MLSHLKNAVSTTKTFDWQATVWLTKRLEKTYFKILIQNKFQGRLESVIDWQGRVTREFRLWGAPLPVLPCTWAQKQAGHQFWLLPLIFCYETPELLWEAIKWTRRSSPMCLSDLDTKSSAASVISVFRCSKCMHVSYIAIALESRQCYWSFCLRHE